ncbi:2729_t:CDS:1 [Ambispora leptoticha]|uniref:2729_t:CDS:1 n=1 Tax=Ambispora leptoticha TaxID=144679 RepID=A0A9N8VX32_9GLOM|nr:2729_t:CDS:1 [Ambispora leptoticha]
MKEDNNKKVNLLKRNNLKRVTESPISKKRDNDYETTFSYQIERIKRVLKFDPIPYTLDEIFNSEKESHFRKADGKIKRPPNCFIVFRQIATTLIKDTPMSDDDRKFFDNLDQPLLSKILGALWKSFSLAEKSPYQALYSEVVELHKSLYPDWKYAPKRSKAIFKVVKCDSHAQEPPQNQEPQNQEPQYEELQYQELQYQEPQYYEDCSIENQSSISKDIVAQDELMQTEFMQDERMQFEFTQAGINQTTIEPNLDFFLVDEQQAIYPTYEQFTYEQSFFQ